LTDTQTNERLQAMKLAIVAATGGIGGHATRQALEAGHEVIAIVRNPRALGVDVPAVAADLTTASEETIVPALAGVDAVLSGLGPRSLSDAGVVSAGTRAVVTAMGMAGVRRIVIVTAAPIGTVASPGRPNPPRHDPGDGFVMRYVLEPTIKAILRKPYADLAVAEDVLRDSALDWTVVRPPRLTNGPHTGRYRTAVDRNVRGGFTISRADVADLMLRVVGERDTIGHTIGVAR
jgi:putative NADH-flavin reductase